MVSLILICNILDSLVRIITHVDTLLELEVLSADNLSKFVNRLDSQINLLG